MWSKWSRLYLWSLVSLVSFSGFLGLFWRRQIQMVPRSLSYSTASSVLRQNQVYFFLLYFIYSWVFRRNGKILSMESSFLLNNPRSGFLVGIERFVCISNYQIILCILFIYIYKWLLEWFSCPEGITPNSGLTGPNNTI